MNLIQSDPSTTVVGNWILTHHSLAPNRDYFIKHCKSLSRRRIVDNLLRFQFVNSDAQDVSIHYSRLAFVGGPLAALLDEPSDKEKIDVDTGKRIPLAKQNGSAEIRVANDRTVAIKPGSGQKDVDMDMHPPTQPVDDSLKVSADNGPSQDEQSNSETMDVDENTDTSNMKHNQKKSGTDEGMTEKTLSAPLLGKPTSRVVVKQEYMVQKPAVKLSEKDTPRTFAVITQFLYCEEIQFNYLTFDEIVSLANAAHRWSLTDLFMATFSYVQAQDLLAGGLGIRTFIPLVSHPSAPESFRRYFCISTGHSFNVLYPRLKARKVTENTTAMKLTPPPIWEVAIAQNFLSHLIHCISLYSDESYDVYLLDVILRYYEAKKDKSDDDVLALLSQLNWDEIDPVSVFDREGLCKNWSARAIRLAALASYAPETQSLEVHIPWNIPLQKLLKNPVWSFQTEHVMCGPYVCYLHVRKGEGPEVSLFVHIWYKDGKPIGDEARHKAVRVKCRATERNCRCDSSKQWSDATHGFLENLKFEGKLDGYPGLGWSQFLEEKRLDEWRNSHGEDCGLSITTVLQFVQPRRQFEGPARRTIAPSSTPMRLASPIQKKNRTPSRMKLRESR